MQAYCQKPVDRPPGCIPFFSNAHRSNVRSLQHLWISSHKFHVAGGRKTRLSCGQPILVKASQGSSDNTIKSLESILGSSDDDNSAKEKEPQSLQASDNEGPLAPKPRRNEKTPEAAEKRVQPLYVYVIYYCFIVVYLAAAWLQATDGDLAASTLVDGLVNDHLAVASGQVPRLATAGFVCGGPLELFMQLATLLTVGAEAEALLGYSLFWAVYWLANLSGGLADASLSELPVTYGPANAAAGIVGALAAYYVRNFGLEERIDSARKAARMRKRQLLDGLGSSDEGEIGSGGGKEERAGKSSKKKDKVVAVADASRDSIEDAEAEVEVLPLLSFTFSAKLSAEARGLLNVLAALVVAGQGLLEFGDASSSASWIGLIGAFWAGAVLTYGAGPQYEVQLTDPGTERAASAPDAVATAGEGTGGWQQEASSRRVEKAGPTADGDGLMVVDVCPLPRRQLVLGGYVAGLAAVIFGWLAWMGTDI